MVKWFRDYPLFRRWGLYRLGAAVAAAAVVFGFLDSTRADALVSVLAAILLVSDRNIEN